ncbi:hypothetical protein Q5741_16285 [Paenibacillus sp. JX-17]|uniref:Uncharacterized protein n=1 Tax=Paenibacillus lacisoli TaxID=3064525 RepID=A0ABT9CFB8_9BACL|nr:hypothetical protein [Paenibacillus sp. JX-17]MDO7907971.1 hypothetical protein [Paenibacillus sp. JX-17]
MVIIDEVYRNVIFDLPEHELTRLVECIKSAKEEDIETLKNKINRYEQKRRAEEALYQSMSPFRRLFAGRPASHHQAVEYMVHVKERFKKIDKIKSRIRELDHILDLLRTKDHPNRELLLSPELIREIRLLREREALSP